MGQQQLLLLVLGIVIVGLAVVVGINAFSENRTKSNADALVTDALRIASDVQAWALKPGQFGGKKSGEDLDAVTFDKIGYPNSGGPYSNVNGEFNFSDGSDGETTCDAPGNGPTVSIYAWNDETDNCIVIGIAGTSADDIETTVNYGN